MRVRTVLLALTLLALPVPTAAEAAVPGPGVLAYDGPGGIYTAARDGTGAVRRIVNGGNPLVSPDGRRLVYTGPGGALWLANTDGTGQSVLANGVRATAWSPDGTRLVGDLPYPRGLAIVTVATRQVAAVPGSATEHSAVWSPDGTLIASRLGPSFQDTDQVLRRPDGSGRSVRPRFPTGPWSRDGRTMLWSGPEGEVYGVDTITGALDTSAPTVPSWVITEGYSWGEDGVYSSYLVTFPFDPEPRPAESHLVLTDGREIANALNPSYGGGTFPADTDGPPPAVAGLTATATPSAVHLSWQPGPTTDYAGVEVRYALGATPPATVAAGLDGGRLLTTSRDLGALPPDRQVAVSVFSRDWTGHVGTPATAVLTTPHLTATTLTAHATPQDLVYGGRTTIAGTVARAYDGAPTGGVTLTVANRVYGSTGAFTTRGTVLTGPDGTFAFAQAPGIGYEYRIGYAGDADRAATSGTATVRVARRVVNTVDHATARAGTAVHLTGSAAPPLVAGKTYLQVLCGDHPCTLGPHNTDATGRVVYTITAPARGTAKRYRVLVPGTAGYLDGAGPWVTITGT
jgi:hypothetical protein